MRPGRLLLAALLIFPLSLEAQRIQLLVPMSELTRRAVADSNDPVAHYELALALLLDRKYDAAERELVVSTEIDPHFAAGLLARAMLPYARQPRLWDVDRITSRTPAETVRILEESRRLSRLAFMLDPMVDLKVMAVILPPRGKVGGGSGDLYNILMLGFEQFWVGNYGESERLITRIIESVREPDRPRRIPGFIYWYRGLAAAHQGNFAVAQADFDLLLQRAVALEQEAQEDELGLVPFSASNPFRYLLGIIRVKAGAPDSGAVLLQQALEADLGLFPAHSALATMYESRRRWNQAIVERERALEGNPDNPILLYELASTLARSGNTALALDPLRRAMEANPRNPRIPYLLGQVALREREGELARESLQRFLQSAPSKFNSQIVSVRAQLDSLARAP